MGLTALVMTLACFVSIEVRALPFSNEVLESYTAAQREELSHLLQAARDHEDSTYLIRTLATLLGDQLELPSMPTSQFADFSLPELSKKAAALSTHYDGDNSRSSTSFTLHLKSFASKLNPDDLDLAFELERSMVREKIELKWASARPSQAAGKPTTTWTIDLIGSTSTGLTSSGTGGLQKTQALINGLLVRELDGSKFAGSASRMNATAIPASRKTAELEIHYNQEVGESMKGALERTQTFLSSRHEMPKGFEVEISFEEQYIPKDGPSAAIATTLLLESMISGAPIDPGFAVTGDMSETGEVGGVGGIDGKIRGAVRKNCTVVAIPSDNRNVISDLLALEGVQSLTKIQIFEISTFAEAESLAKPVSEKEDDLKKAIAVFSEVQTVLNRANGASYLKNAAVRAKLREVVSLAPNHLSARFLLLESLGRSPKHLSLGGSLQTIDRSAAPLIRALREGKFGDEGDSFKSDEFYETVSRLQRLRPRLDPRTIACADSIVDYSKVWRIWKNDRPNTPGKQRELINQIIAAQKQVADRYDEIYSREDVKDELGIEDEE